MRHRKREERRVETRTANSDLSHTHVSAKPTISTNPKNPRNPTNAASDQGLRTMDHELRTEFGATNSVNPLWRDVDDLEQLFERLAEEAGHRVRGLDARPGAVLD